MLRIASAPAALWIARHLSGIAGRIASACALAIPSRRLRLQAKPATGRAGGAKTTAGEKARNTSSVHHCSDVNVLGAQDELREGANGSAATGAGGDPVGDGLDFVARIGDGGSETS
jgi:hypothetical protein